ncbi:hypothetical protein [Streptomyces zhihengii]
MTAHPAGFESTSDMFETERACVVRLVGEVDIDVAPRLGLTMEAARASGKQLVLDVAGLQFLDLVPLHELLEPPPGGGRIWVAGALAVEPRRLIALTGNHRAFRYFPDLPSALAALG